MEKNNGKLTLAYSVHKALLHSLLQPVVVPEEGYNPSIHAGYIDYSFFFTRDYTKDAYDGQTPLHAHVTHTREHT